MAQREKIHAAPLCTLYSVYYGKNCEHCRDYMSGSPVLCDTPLNTSYLFIDFQLYFNDSKQIIAHSIFHTNRGKRQKKTKYYRYELMPPNLPDVNNFTCGNAHRTDYMCGNCIKGYGPAAYAYYGIPCAPCHHKTRGWLYYILLELGFPTIICVLFLMFQVKITSGFMIGFALYCQIIANIFTCSLYFTVLQEKSSVLTQVMLMCTLYGFWNMDFFRLVVPHFCVSEQLSTLGVVSLGYISAVYLLLLTLVLYSLIKLHIQDAGQSWLYGDPCTGILYDSDGSGKPVPPWSMSLPHFYFFPTPKCSLCHSKYCTTHYSLCYN